MQRLCGTPLQYSGFVGALWYTFGVQRLCGSSVVQRLFVAVQRLCSTPLQCSGFVVVVQPRRHDLHARQGGADALTRESDVGHHLLDRIPLKRYTKPSAYFLMAAQVMFLAHRIASLPTSTST